MIIEKIFIKIGLSPIAAELLTISVILVALGFLLSILVGRFRLDNVLINTYIAVSILSVTPNGWVANYHYANFIFFIIFVTLLTFLGDNFFDIHISGAALKIWKMLVMSFLEAGLLLSIVISLLPRKDVLEYISSGVYDYLASPIASFFWMVAPLIFLFFIRGKK